MNNFQEDQQKKVAAYKREQEEYNRIDEMEDLKARVWALQLANQSIIRGATEERRLNQELVALLSAHNDPKDENGWTEEDLKFLKDCGIKP